MGWEFGHRGHLHHQGVIVVLWEILDTDCSIDIF